MAQKNNNETILGKIRKKVNKKVVAGTMALATLGVGSKLYSDYAENKAQTEKKQNIETIEKYWQEVFSKADTYMYDENKSIYAAVYEIPEDVQKDLASECQRVEKTNANLDKRLGEFAEMEKKGMDVSKNKEYKLLQKTRKDMPEISEPVKTLAKHGNLINKLDLFEYALDISSGYVCDCGVTLETNPRVERQAGANSFGSDYFTGLLKEAEIGEPSATAIAKEEARKLMTHISTVEANLKKYGKENYIAPKEDVQVQQRKVDIHERAHASERYSRLTTANLATYK
ncbi:MAG: hypothetical protein IKN71_07150 [Alphaproteobacteria bacterium]|nr:hypothetical protein [Alphaproteobacteria bacterium]